MVQMVLASSTCKVPNRAQTAVARPARSTVRVQATGMWLQPRLLLYAADLTVPHVATAGLPREQQADLRTVAAGVAAAALLFTGSAQAGVILEQPEVKKVPRDGMAHDGCTSTTLNTGVSGQQGL